MCYNVADVLTDTEACYLISTLRFVYNLYRDYVSYNSMLVATIRYTFIALRSWAEGFGLSKLRAFFITCSIGIPLINNFMYEATQPIEHVWIMIFHNKNNLSTAKVNNFTADHMSPTYDSPIFMIVKQHFPYYLRYSLIVMENIMMIILYSNLVEGVIYAHTTYLYYR